MAAARTAASPKTAMSKTKLCELLDLANVKALEKWFQHNVFRAHMDEFLSSCWLPKQNEKGKGGKARQGPMLSAVRAAIRNGEAAGQAKYSTRYPDKSDWNDLDHYARFICVAGEDNVRTQFGVFFRKNLDRADIEEKMWKTLHTFLDYHRKKPTSADSTPTNTPQAARKTAVPKQSSEQLSSLEIPPLARQSDHSKNQTNQNKAKGKGKRKAESELQTGNDAVSRPHKRRISRSQAKVDPEDESDDESIMKPLAIADASHDTQLDPAKKRHRKKKRRPVKVADAIDSEQCDRDREFSLNTGESTTDAEVTPQPEESEMDRQDENPLDLLRLEAEGRPFNLFNGWHKHEMIRRVLESFDANEFKRETVSEVLTEERLNHLNAESQTWEKIVAADIDKETPDGEPTPRNTNKQSEASKPIVQLPIATESDLQQHAIQEALFANAQLEGGDYEEACAFLGIENPDKPWMEGMIPAQQLQPWQVIGIQFIFDCIKCGLRGCVIADIVGLGKTWEVTGYLLAATRELEKRREEVNKKIRTLEAGIGAADKSGREEISTKVAQLQESVAYRPHLILCPLNLISQWQAEISTMCGSDTFKFVSYYGDWRGSKNDRSKTTSKYLEKDDIIFNGSKESGRTIVFSSYETWVQRHGPQAAKVYRKKSGVSEKTIAKTPAHLPEGWERSLEGKFATVSLDEAHKIKNEDTATSTAIQWLKPQLYIMATATPCSNRGTDFSGFLKLIDPGNHYWSERFGDQYKDINPFNDGLEANDPSHDLVLSYDNFKRFVSPKKLPESLQGKRLRKIWSKCVLRRTYGSKVCGMKIGDRLPACQVLRVQPSFTGTEKAHYDQLSKPVRENLVCKSRDGKRLIYWRDKYRKLVLLSTWTGFGDESLEKVVRSKTMSVWAEEGDTIIWQWYNAVHSEPVKKEDVATLLQWVTTGAPKLRALLAILDDTLITKEQKELIWTTFPAQQLLLFGTLRLLKIDARLFHAGLTMSDRKKLVEEFTTNRNGSMVLVGNFFLNCCGLNLHYLCFRTSLFDLAPSEPMRTQALGRVRRFGQRRLVQVIDYCNPGSFDWEQLALNANKVIPQLIATLNIHHDTHVRSSDLQEEFSLGQWVKVGKKLMSVEQAQKEGIRYAETDLLDEEALIVNLNKALAGDELELSNVPGLTDRTDVEVDEEGTEQISNSGEDSNDENSLHDSSGRAIRDNITSIAAQSTVQDTSSDQSSDHESFLARWGIDCK